VVGNQWREACNIFRLDWKAFPLQALKSGIDVERVPKDNGIDNQTQGSQLILLSFAVTLPQLSPLTVEDRSRKPVPFFSPV
jgi:hypothetical protein